MLVSVILNAAVVKALAVCPWPRRRPVARPAAPVPQIPRASSTEGLFVFQLLRGDVTRGQYHAAMACLAARDAARAPLPLPD